MFVNLLQRLLVVLIELHLLPELVRRMRSLGCLHVEVAYTLLLPNRSVLRVGERTRPTIAQPCEVVLVSAEVLTIGLDPKRTMLVVDDLPDHVVNNHDCSTLVIIIRNVGLFAVVKYASRNVRTADI